MFYQENVLGDYMKKTKENEELSIIEMLQAICEDICDNYCKYNNTADDNGDCDITRNGTCPLHKLY